MQHAITTRDFNTILFIGQDIDEDELERELEELEQEDLDKDLLGVPSTSELPEVPTSEIKDPSVAIKDKKKGELPANPCSLPRSTGVYSNCCAFPFFPHLSLEQCQPSQPKTMRI